MGLHPYHRSEKLWPMTQTLSPYSSTNPTQTHRAHLFSIQSITYPTQPDEHEKNLKSKHINLEKGYICLNNFTHLFKVIINKTTIIWIHYYHYTSTYITTRLKIQTLLSFSSKSLLLYFNFHPPFLWTKHPTDINVNDIIIFHP